MKNVKISTTDSFPNGKITSYRGLVTEVGWGTQSSSDFFTEAFLGFTYTAYTGGYKNEIHEMLDPVIESLKEKAIAQNANAIIGFHFDFETITKPTNLGGSLVVNPTAFVIYAYGTAVSVEFDEISTEIRSISLIDVQEQLHIEEIEKKLSNGNPLEEHEWKILINNPKIEYLDSLLSNKHRSDFPDNSYRFLKRFLISLDSKALSDFLYNNCISSFIENLIVELHLFSIEHIKKFITNGNIDDAIKFLSVDKNTYNSSEIKEMFEIKEMLLNLPQLCEIKKNNTGIFKVKEVDVWECKCKRINTINREFCDSCERDKFGLYKSQREKIKLFNKKCDILRKLSGMCETRLDK